MSWGRAAGLGVLRASIFHLSLLFFFLCLGGAESRRRGGCEGPGALHLFQRCAATSLCRLCGQCCAPVQGLGGLWGFGGGQDVGCAQPAKVMEQAASPNPGLARSGGHLAARIGPLGACQGYFLASQPPSSPPLISSGVVRLLAKAGMGGTLGAACPGRRGGVGGCHPPPKPGYPNPRGMLGARAEATSSGKRIPSPGRSISMATPRGHRHPAWTRGTHQHPQSPPDRASGWSLQGRAVTALNNPKLSGRPPP